MSFTFRTTPDVTWAPLETHTLYLHTDSFCNRPWYSEKRWQFNHCVCFLIRCVTSLTYAMSLPVEHRPQTIRLYPALSCAAVFIFLQLNLPSPDLFSKCFSVVLFLWGLVASTVAFVWQCYHCFVSVYDPVLFFRRSCSKTGCSLVFFHSSLRGIAQRYLQRRGERRTS